MVNSRFLMHCGADTYCTTVTVPVGSQGQAFSSLTAAASWRRGAAITPPWDGSVVRSSLLIKTLVSGVRDGPVRARRGIRRHEARGVPDAVLARHGSGVGTWPRNAIDAPCVQTYGGGFPQMSQALARKEQVCRRANPAEADICGIPKRKEKDRWKCSIESA
jgi:hypothetical protein